MSKRDKQVLLLAGALLGGAYLSKLAKQEAQALGLSMAAVAALGWLASRLV